MGIALIIYSFYGDLDRDLSVSNGVIGGIYVGIAFGTSVTRQIITRFYTHNSEIKN